MVKTIQGILSPAQVYGLHATPKVVLPAPPLGFVNNILGVSDNMVFVSASYTGATKLVYGSSDGSSVFQDENILEATGNYNLPALKTNATQVIFSTSEDFYVTTDSVAAAGDSTINFYIIYEQVQIGS